MMVMLSEWTKLRALRSTYVTLLVAAVTALLATGVVATSTASVQASQAPPFGAVAGIFAGWLSYPALAVGILGIITITAEYSTG
jgi:ABC-2 type transport system permease protein